MLPPLLALLPLLASAAKQQCYGIDGTPSDDSQQPCNPEAVFSPCCALNKAKPDVCLSSGLCYAQDSGYEGFIYSNGCTDPTGRADACPHVCPDRTNNWKGGPVVASYNVLQCREGSHFCCRKSLDPENCCSNAGAVVSVNVGQLRFPTTTASASAVCHPDRAVSEKPCPKDNSAVVGGAVGAVLGGALLASLGALAVVCVQRRRTKQDLYDTQDRGATAHELPIRPPVHEMQSGEMDASKTAGRWS
ncbi:hypothetical protein CDD80_3191 [Ophiocordyceps camponoti-rufipedis]|uniref:Mid2 domain-containing protein n=1 Tax=Ophiocordyceps camponoti-rufipedis TaxID=2004952 RepID=A0A2C5Y878_9HYPO|nr:hypothetical protein CDD80_3191 [Ophiocordyceps camponoti-rufipedis]